MLRRSKAEKRREPVLANVTCCADLKTRLKLETLQLDNATLDKRKFPGAIAKCHGGTFILFENGKVNGTGFKSTVDARKAMDSVAKDLGATAENFRVVNLVVSSDLGFRVDLGRMDVEHQDLCHWSNELFPGLYYRPFKKTKKGHLIVAFWSGKFYVTGVRDLDVATRMLARFKLFAATYRIAR